MSDISKSILQGAQEALDYVNGVKEGAKAHKVCISEAIDVLVIRNKLHMERREFARAFGFSIRTLEKWERGERIPEGPARAYLTVIDKAPLAVVRALRFG